MIYFPGIVTPKILEHLVCDGNGQPIENQEVIAGQVAAFFHRGQERKYTGDSYFIHPNEVAAMIKRLYCSYTSCRFMVPAALLHDTLEDTALTENLLRRVFGDRITDYVVWLTACTTPEDGNRATRKSIERNRLNFAPWEVQAIKTADMLSNARSICEHDKHFAPVYMKEFMDMVEPWEFEPSVNLIAHEALEFIHSYRRYWRPKW